MNGAEWFREWSEGHRLPNPPVPNKHTKYVVAHGMEGSNNRRQALTMAVITASLLNRTLLLCDPPLLEMFDMEAIQQHVPVHATIRCSAWHDRPRRRKMRCQENFPCNQKHWKVIPALGGPDRVDINKMQETWANKNESLLSSAHILAAQDYWGVPWWNFKLGSMNKSNGQPYNNLRQKLTDIHYSVRYAPAVFRIADKYITALKEIAQSRRYHSLHIRTGDRIGHPLLSCPDIGAVNVVDADAVCKSRMPNVAQGSCKRMRHRGDGVIVNFSDALKKAFMSGTLKNNETLFIAAANIKHPEVQHVLLTARQLNLNPITYEQVTDVVGRGPLPATVPSCVSHKMEKRQCLAREFDLVSAVEQIIVGSASGVYIPNFPSTWDEHAIDIQCWSAAKYQKPGVARGRDCASFLYTNNEISSTVRSPPFTAAWNKRNFVEKVRSYCGVF